MQYLDATLCGVPFRFACDFPELAEYARLHLARLTPAGGGTADVEIELRWHEGIPPSGRSATEAEGVVRVDRDIYVDGDRLWWFRVDDLRDLRLAFSWEGGRLRVTGDFYFRVGNSATSDRLRKTLQPGRASTQRRRRFTTLLYYLVYYPCWWWAEVSRQAHPIHAGGVVTPGGVILAAGGSGVGKSTLTVLLGLQPEHRFLADSFVLHRGREVEPVREPLLLDQPARDWIGGAADALEPIPWDYMLGRRGFHFPGERLAERGSVALVLFPRRAHRPFVREIPSQTAAIWLSAGDMVINDLRRYWAFAAALEYLQPRGLVAQREDSARRLLEAVPCYEVGLVREQPSGELAARLTGLLEGRE